jgi:tRNA threonylcarbamoyladenosine biosynthesis protein TsaE
MRSRETIIDQLLKGLSTDSGESTQKVAQEFATQLPTDTVLALYGDLGVGKTTFVGGLAQAWGIEEPITSPSYNLYSIYVGQRQLVHFDAYRLTSASDLDALMIEDFLKSPWSFVIEWPERIEASLPQKTWRLSFSIERDNRHYLRLTLPS